MSAATWGKIWKTYSHDILKDKYFEEKYLLDILSPKYPHDILEKEYQGDISKKKYVPDILQKNIHVIF